MAVVTLLSPLPIQHFVDSNGNALTGGKLFAYLAGTTTKTNTYTDATGATPNANPVILNTRGEANVWLTPGTAYKFVLSPSTDTDPPTNPIWTVDQINSVPGPSSLITTLASYAALQANTNTVATSFYITGYASIADGGEGVFTYQPTDTTSADNGGTIAVDANNRRWYRETQGLPYSALWFGVNNATGDNSANLAKWISAAQTALRTLYLPNTGAVYSYATGLSISGVSFVGEGGAFLNYTGSGTAVTYTANGSSAGCHIDDMQISSTTGAIGLLITGNSNPLVVNRLVIYPFSASGATALKINVSQLIAFKGGWIRNVGKYHVDVGNALSTGNIANDISFEDMTFQQDVGQATQTAMMNIAVGNNWLVQRCSFTYQVVAACTAAIDIASGLIKAGDTSSIIKIVFNDIEGTFTNVVRSGSNGPYSGAGPFELEIGPNGFNGTITNGYNVAYTSNSQMSQTTWGTLGGVPYIIDAHCANITIQDTGYTGGATVSGSATGIAIWTKFGLQNSNGNILMAAGQTSGAAAASGTLTNAPLAGNPQFWLPLTINGTQYWIPAWHA